MIRKNIGYILVGIIGIGFGFLGGLAVGAWTRVSKTFLDIKATDIVGLLITVALGLFVASWIARFVNYDAKRRELFIKALEKLDLTIASNYSSMLDYMRNHSVPKSRSITKGFSSATKQVGLIQQIQKETQFLSENDCQQLEILILKFKGAVTDSPFGTPNPSFGQNRSDEISSTHSDVTLHINLLMLKLYS